MAAKTSRTLPTLLKAVRDCLVCEAHLPLGASPVLQVGVGARILIIGQVRRAPMSMRAGCCGTTPAGSGCASGWGSTRQPSTTRRISPSSRWATATPGAAMAAICRRAALVPRLWLDQLLAKLPLTPDRPVCAASLPVRAAPTFIDRNASKVARLCARVHPLPHPSARNTPWFQSHPWFEHDLEPMLRGRVHRLLAG